MILGIKDSWQVEIEVDYLLGDEFQQMEIEEQAGLSLPVLSLKFTSERNEAIRRLLKEQYITIGFGKRSIETRARYEIFDFSLKNGPRGEFKQDVVLYAFCGEIEYLRLPRFLAYTSESVPQNSSDVWSTVVSRHGLTPETMTTQDRMNWLQCSKTDRHFLHEVTSHGFYKEGTPLLSGITKDGKALYLPFSALPKPKLLFGNVADADHSVGTYMEDNQTGFLSTVFGRKRRTLYRNMEEGTDDLVETNATTQIVSPGLRDGLVKYNEGTYLNDNIHPEWIRAYEQNVQLKASLSADAISIPLVEYSPVRLLDRVNFIYLRPEDGIQEKVSGEWLVVGGNLQILGNTFQQYLTLSRERIL